MVKSSMVDTKVRTLIKAFLVFNKGKKFSAKQICEWINSYRFGLNGKAVYPKTISYHISQGKYNPSNILNEVNVEKKHNLNYYWVEA